MECYNTRVLRVELSLLIRFIVPKLEIMIIKSVQRLSGNMLRIDTGNYCIKVLKHYLLSLRFHRRSLGFL